MNKLATLLAITASQAEFAQADDDKCRALAMSGGANKGSWEIGVVWGLLHYGDPADYTYDVITGVSAGSLNTAMFAVFEKGDEVNMTESVSATWASIDSNSEVFTTWDGSWPPSKEYLAKAMFEDPSLLNTANAVEFLTEQIAPQGSIKRNFVTAAVDANTGEYVNFSQDNCSFEELPTCAIASGSIPAAFVPTYFRDKVLIDGGSAWNINVDAAINKCIDLGYETKDIIVDMIACSYHEPDPQVVSKSAIDNLMGSRQIHSYYKGMQTIQTEIRAYNDVDYRFYFQKKDDGCPWPIFYDVDFRNETTWCMQEAGRKDAKDMLELGQGKIRQTLDEWFDKQEVQKEYPNFRDYLDYVWNLV